MTTKLITLNSVKAIIIGSEVSLERLSQIELWCLHYYVLLQLQKAYNIY